MGTPLISFKNLSLTFGERSIFDQAELTIEKGDRIGLIGLNGQGKSTLFQVLIEEVSADHTNPPFIYDKTNDHFEIFLIPQEINIEDYKHLTIEEYYLAFYPKLHEVYQKLRKDFSNAKLLEEFENLQGWEIQNNYVSYLKGFELEGLSRSIENLSGGERKKMALSAGLSSRADFLLWDEPTNHLDIETIERFEDELMNSQKTYMIITHDRYLLNHTTDRIFHIERGKITDFKGTYLDYLIYLDEKEAELKKNLEKLENKHRRELAWMRQGIKARGTRSKKRVEGFHNIKEEISNLKGSAKKSANFGLSHSGRKSKLLVEIEEGSFSYEDKEIFKNINLSLHKKDKIALIGPNGAGKSTLINIFQDKLELKAGHKKSAQDLKVVVFDQNRESLDEEKTPLELVGDGNDFISLSNGERKHINSYLSDFLFSSDQIRRPVSTLSGGEKKRLQLAMFMCQSADLWIFDEPTNDLDIETIELLEKELKSYQSAVLIIGHDRAFLDNTCEKTWLVHDKKVEVFEGGYTQVAPYLHALEQEKELKEAKEKTKDDHRPQEDEEKKGLTYNEKKRYKVIESEIEKAEFLVCQVEEKLANFNFQNMDNKKQDEYQKLNEQKAQYEKEVEKLFSEWEDLSSRA